ncbi:MAG: MBL fold metallo-hydrolase [Nocardioidaceae bacterium]|nr:MBL fold metallo-hydrolase [Nocardioidaceae bacterium]
MRDIPHEAGFVEFADRCWLARSTFLDVNVGLVAGDRGLLLVDTGTSEVAARRVVEEVRRLGVGGSLEAVRVVAVVNTHHHFDHTFGNIVMSEEYDAPPVYAHDTVPDRFGEASPLLQQEAAGEASVAEHAEIASTRLLAPTHTFSSAKVVDLGDRLVELVHPGRGHTAGDVVVRVGDADVVFAGDLVEESVARNGVPGFGDDCYPMEWPATLDLVISMLTGDSVVVPGHGLPVDSDFVSEQRSSIGVVAETIRDLAGRGVPVAEALGAAQWPYPADDLGDAVRRGYAHLPRQARSLPLI